LESSRDKIQECAKIYRVFHSKKLKWPSRDLQMTLVGQTNGTILWPPQNQTTFVWNIFLSRAWFSRYSTRCIKMGHPVYTYIYIYRVYQNSRIRNAQRDSSCQKNQFFSLAKVRLSITFLMRVTLSFNFTNKRFRLRMNQMRRAHSLRSVWAVLLFC